MADPKAINAWHLADFQLPDKPCRQRWVCRGCHGRFGHDIPRWRFVTPVGDDQWSCRACIEAERGAA